MGTSITYHTRLGLHGVSGYSVEYSAISQSLQIYWYEYNIGDPCDVNLWHRSLAMICWIVNLVRIIHVWK